MVSLHLEAAADGRMVVLVIGAHPDDIEIGAGATVHKLSRAKHVVHGLILSSGGLRAACSEREEAAISAAKILGYYPHFARLEDGCFADSEAEKQISAAVEALNPHVIIAHSASDVHRDHVNAHRASVSAGRKIANLLFFEGPYSQSFIPKLYVPVEEENLEAKVASLIEHRKVLSRKPAYLDEDYIRALAHHRGVAAGHTYAEAFDIGILTLLLLEEDFR